MADNNDNWVFREADRLEDEARELEIQAQVDYAIDEAVERWKQDRHNALIDIMTPRPL